MYFPKTDHTLKTLSFHPTIHILPCFVSVRRPLHVVTMKKTCKKKKKKKKKKKERERERTWKRMFSCSANQRPLLDNNVTKSTLYSYTSCARVIEESVGQVLLGVAS